MATPTTSIRPNLHLQRRASSGSSPSPSTSPSSAHLLPDFIVTTRPTNERWQPSSAKLPTCPDNQHQRLRRSDLVEVTGSLCCPLCGLEIAPVLIIEDLDGRQNVPAMYWLNGYRGSPDNYTFGRGDQFDPMSENL